VSERPFQILLVEDNPAFVRLTQEAFRKSSIRGNKSVANDGVEAILSTERFWLSTVSLSPK
jgi:CheY-like chemotaxis protein